MTTTDITLNGQNVISARFLIPWKGVWICDVELDVAAIETFSAQGPAAIVVGANTYTGVIDPRYSGSWVDRAFVRVVGGQGKWDSIAPQKHFNIPSGGILISTAVYADTAASVGEALPLDPTPVSFQSNYIRVASPARNVFGDRDWYVDLTTGVATVAAWPPAVLDPTSSTIVDFDPIKNIVKLTSDSLVLPGTVLSDPRFNGSSPIVRTVEQTFDKHGSNVVAYCSANPVERLSEAFTLACRQAIDSAHLKVYQYRFTIPATGTDLQLQAITPGAPNLNPISQWNGLNGAADKFAPSTIILVGFTADTPPQPYIASFSPLSTPLQVDIQATTEASLDAATLNLGAALAKQITIGVKAAAVKVGASPAPVTPAAWANALIQALLTFTTSLGSATDPAVVSAATALATALGALPPDATTTFEAT